ncbi:MAG: hypothetical protein PHV07_07105 [Oscillospiraceae bacterium]|nr:hypothetical protein [Oscillospiraceae bacterium]
MIKLNGTIMSANIPVATITNSIVTNMDNKLAPLFFKRCKDISQWLESRAIDSHRANSRLLKKALRLEQKDDISAVLSVNAVTIIDNFWFKEEGSSLTWEEVRFKENIFDNLALRGDPDSFNQKPSRTPELTNTGSYEKCWRLINGKWWMYKSGNDNEIFSELFIYKLGITLGFNMATYEYADGYVRTLDSTDNALVNFEPAESLIGDEEDYNKNFDLYYSFSVDIAAEYLRLIYLDTICMNMDRHTKNYGILRNSSTGEITSLAPNYDNNISLISRGYPQNIARKNDKLIQLFLDFLIENEQARELFINLNIPEITEELLNNCMDNIPISVNRSTIISFVLNGQQHIQDFIEQTLNNNPTLTM